MNQTGLAFSGSLASGNVVQLPNAVLNGLTNFTMELNFKTLATSGALFSAARPGGATQIELLPAYPGNNINNAVIRVQVANISTASDNFFVLPHGMTYADNAWHHLAMVRKDGLDLEVFLDGVRLTRVANFNSPSGPQAYQVTGPIISTNAVLGQELNPTDPFAYNGAAFIGKLDEFRV